MELKLLKDFNINNYIYIYKMIRL